MTSQETVQALMDSVQRGDFDRAKTLISDDFRFKGMVRRSISGKTWLRMSASLRMAFTALNYHFKVNSADGNVVNTTSQMSGNNRGAFDLTGLRMGVISATNKNFSTAVEKHGHSKKWKGFIMGRPANRRRRIDGDPGSVGCEIAGDVICLKMYWLVSKPRRPGGCC